MKRPTPRRTALPGGGKKASGFFRSRDPPVALRVAGALLVEEDARDPELRQVVGFLDVAGIVGPSVPRAMGEDDRRERPVPWGERSSRPASSRSPFENRTSWPDADELDGSASGGAGSAAAVG